MSTRAAPGGASPAPSAATSHSAAGGPGGPGGSARVRVQRRVEFSDTDATGHHHFTAVLRWMEQAETVLHSRLGLSRLVAGQAPRVHLSTDFIRRLYHPHIIDIEIAVESVGRSSLTYEFSVSTDGEAAARGRLVVVLTDPDTGRPRAWPDDVRAVLLGGGAQSPELLG